MKKSSLPETTHPQAKSRKVDIILDQEDVYEQFVQLEGPNGYEDGSENSFLTGISHKKPLVPKKITQSKETLYVENLELKEKNHQLKDEKVKLTTQIEVLNKKLAETNKTIAELARKSKSPLHKYVKMNQNLKNSVNSAQAEIKQKEDELKILKKDMRYSQIHELKEELNGYKEECLRLKTLIKDNSENEAEFENKIKANLSLFESLQKENRKIREKLEQVLNEERKFNEIEGAQVKSSSVSKNNKKKIAKLVDENLKLKNSVAEKVKELIEIENSSKSEIAYLRRKIEEFESQVSQLKLDVQKNEFHRIFYECRFSSFELVKCSEISIKKAKNQKKTNTKGIQVSKKCKKCNKINSIQLKSTILNKQTQTVKNLIENPKPALELQDDSDSISELNEKPDIRCESIDLQRGNTWIFKQNKEKIEDFEEFEIVIPTNTFFQEEEPADKLQSQLKQLKKNTIFCDRQEQGLKKTETLIRPKILSFAKDNSDKEIKGIPKIPSLKLISTAKLPNVNLFSKVLRAPKTTKSSGKVKELSRNVSLSDIYNSKEFVNKKLSNSMKLRSGSNKFSVSDYKDDSRDIILDEVLYNKMYEDSAHSSLNDSEIFVNENNLNSVHSNEKSWNSSKKGSLNQSGFSNYSKLSMQK